MGQWPQSCQLRPTSPTGMSQGPPESNRDPQLTAGLPFKFPPQDWHTVPTPLSLKWHQ